MERENEGGLDRPKRRKGRVDVMRGSKMRLGLVVAVVIGMAMCGGASGGSITNGYIWCSVDVIESYSNLVVELDPNFGTNTVW